MADRQRPIIRQKGITNSDRATKNFMLRPGENTIIFTNEGAPISPNYPQIIQTPLYFGGITLKSITITEVITVVLVLDDKAFIGFDNFVEPEYYTQRKVAGGNSIDIETDYHIPIELWLNGFKTVFIADFLVEFSFKQPGRRFGSRLWDLVEWGLSRFGW